MDYIILFVYYIIIILFIYGLLIWYFEFMFANKKDVKVRS